MNQRLTVNLPVHTDSMVFDLVRLDDNHLHFAGRGLPVCHLSADTAMELARTLMSATDTESFSGEVAGKLERFAVLNHDDTVILTVVVGTGNEEERHPIRLSIGTAFHLAERLERIVHGIDTSPVVLG
ncbi:hypothetical protein [Roseomonas genomospecies 6]|uniref:Uncharacterized protein n=1 Tax=Roseomonas genomospecies 6 TaxID=214106 RepID=A0A9W7KQP3_9PROT|nr:hypothetical protein [Roseomonas genomospecies 6]KAA0677789.1 hypothetical protein DS843_21965 [Roseomonas genomospecies 6]